MNLKRNALVAAVAIYSLSVIASQTTENKSLKKEKTVTSTSSASCEFYPLCDIKNR